MKQPSPFDAYNHTELYQACLRAEILVRPNAAREDMVAYLEGWEEPPEIDENDNVFHSWRHGLINFINEYWKTIQTQLTCPARMMRDPVSPNPKPCFGCTDAQVVTCIVQNQENLKDSEPLRLVRRPRST